MDRVRQPNRAEVWFTATTARRNPRTEVNCPTTAHGGISMLATSYPFLEVFWTMLIFFGFFIWIWILFTVFADLFRRRRHIGLGQGADGSSSSSSCPYLGMFVYLIAQHKGMTERAVAQSKGGQVRNATSTCKITSPARASPTAQIAEGEGTARPGHDHARAEFDQIKQQGARRLVGSVVCPGEDHRGASGLP